MLEDGGFDAACKGRDGFVVAKKSRRTAGPNFSAMRCGACSVSESRASVYTGFWLQTGESNDGKTLIC